MFIRLSERLSYVRAYGLISSATRSAQLLPFHCLPPQMSTARHGATRQQSSTAQPLRRLRFSSLRRRNCPPESLRRGVYAMSLLDEISIPRLPATARHSAGRVEVGTRITRGVFRAAH